MISATLQGQDELTLVVQGRIDTLAADTFAADLEQAVAGLEGRRLVLDAEGLAYISSMGLRVLLGLRKKLPYRLTNVRPEVYEVFHTTGFDQLLDIEKQLRRIDVSGCRIIGHGVTGTVYHLGDDLIAKVYVETTPLDMVKQERAYAQAAFLSGVPTAISYDTVRCGDAYGIVFEMINARPYAESLHDHPDTFDHYARLYARTLKHVHSAPADTRALPRAADKYHAWVDRLSHRYTPEEREIMHRIYGAIPERTTTLHGDYHTKNILLQGEEPILIDMADVSYGHPLFDFSCMALTHRYYPSVEAPETLLHYLGLSHEEMDRLWWILLEEYFGLTDRRRLTEIDRLLTLLGTLRYGLQSAVLSDIPEQEAQRMARTVREKVLPFADEIIGGIFF